MLVSIMHLSWRNIIAVLESINKQNPSTKRVLTKQIKLTSEENFIKRIKYIVLGTQMFLINMKYMFV